MTHPGWWVIAGLGVTVFVLGLLSTTLFVLGLLSTTHWAHETARHTAERFAAGSPSSGEPRVLGYL